jgi:signal transduction histidine kinase
MNSRKFSFYLLTYFSLISLIVLVSLIWAYINYESLLTAYRSSEYRALRAEIELSRVLINELETKLDTANLTAVLPAHAELLTEPFYFNNDQYFYRQNDQFFSYTGSQLAVLQQLRKSKVALSKDVSEQTFQWVKYSFIGSVIFVFSVVLVLFLRLNQRLTRNMSALLANLMSENQSNSFSFQEFDHIDKEIRRFQTKALQTERQTVVSDVLSNWQIEVKKIIHDLKNPLQRIKLLMSNLDAEKSAMALDAVDEIQRNLKEIRSTELTQDINPTEIDIHEFFDRIRSLFYDIEIEIVVTQAQALEFDEYALQRVCSNLIQNAIEAGATKLTFFFSSEHGKSLIDVANNGAKINDPSKLFVPFSTTKKEGSGLGLVIILQFVHLHHGQIYLKHSTDTETMFRIELP